MKINQGSCTETKPKYTAMSGDDYCCYCHAFGMRFIIQRPDPNCYTCGSRRGKASVFPVPALTHVTVRRVGYAFFCLGILATLGLFTAMAVSQELRYPGPNWCGTWEENCQYETLNSGGIGLMNSYDKGYVAMMLGTMILNILGLIGVGGEKRSILRLVGVLLGLFFVAQVTLSGIHGNNIYWGLISYPHESYQQGKVSMYENLKRISPNHDTWDRMQRESKCCGVLSPKDWQEYHSYVPLSCECVKENRYGYNYRGRGSTCTTVKAKGNFTKSVYGGGCLRSMLQGGQWRYTTRQHMMWKAALGLAFAQWFPMFFALVFGFRKKSGEVAYKGVAPPVYEQSLDDCKAIVVNEQSVAVQEGDAGPTEGSAE